MRINPAALSKINWTQAVALGATIATVFGFDLSAEEQAKILAAIATITPVVTLIFRTFFTAKPQ
jgi:hypothetical protein